MLTVEQYAEYKRLEQFFDSLVVSKPLPAFVAPAQAAARPKPFGLERLRSLLERLGNPQRDLRFAHITGTSGKTSTAYFLASLLQFQGYSTGLFTSPPITTTAEYFLLNGALPPVNGLIALANQVKPVIDAEYERHESGAISQFELFVALAFLYFRQKWVDYVVLEAGLGGEHDATNIIPRSEVSIITGIGLDHTRVLGETLPEIAADKLGIARAGTPLLTAEHRLEILAQFRRKTERVNAVLDVCGQAFRLQNVSADADGTAFDYASDRLDLRTLRVNMRGAYQARNAALAMRAVERIAAANGRALDESGLRAGLLATRIPARCEQMQDQPPVILDGAHNPDKIEEFAAYLRTRFAAESVIFVCGFTSGRNLEAMLTPLLTVSSMFCLTRVITGFRATEEPFHVKAILKRLAPDAQADISLDPSVALDAAIAQAERGGQAVCVTGSLYLAGYLRQRWFPEYRLLNYEA